MYKSRKLSDVEKDAITLYERFPNKSVQVIARELLAPPWYIENIVFKYLNGCVKNGVLTQKPLKGNLQIPRKSLSPTPMAVQLARQETHQSKIKLITMNHKED